MTRRINPKGPESDSEVAYGKTDEAFDRLLSRVASTPRVTALADGSLVGEYRLVKQLGKGTFGTVYHGAHTVIGKQAALKVLNAQFSDDAATVERFIDEARAVNRIAHPNIVDIFDFGELQDGRKYCVMELLEGETLTALLDTMGVCTGPLAVRILNQIAAALDAAHEHQIVHRDLKPDNIFISRKVAPGESDVGPVVKLLDFGIARVADRPHGGTASGVVLGTPAYMSPEQCRGARVDMRTDVYALGVVAFKMLTGGLPFEGQNALQFVSQHLNEAPPLASSLNPELPAAVDAVLARMLAKAPEGRPERASVAIQELTAALGTAGVSVRPAGPRATRRWVWGVVFAACLSLPLIVLTVATRHGGPPAIATAAPVAVAPEASHSPPASTGAATPSALLVPAAAASASVATPSARSAPGLKKPAKAKSGVNHELEY